MRHHLCWAVLASASVAGGDAIAKDAPFTAAQVATGEAIYAGHCKACHGEGLVAGSAPPLRGAAFQSHWAGPAHSIADLLSYTQANMPLNAAGSLRRDEYVDVLAFMLARNGQTPGPITLTGAETALKAAGLAVAAPAETASSAGPILVIGPHGTTPSGSGPDQAALRDSATNGTDWLMSNRDLAGTRHSPLTQIDRSNVGRLRALCSFAVGIPAAFQTNPLEYKGTLFFTAAFSTIAIDAATCKLRWRHDWPSHFPNGDRIANRGVALQDGRIVRGTVDGTLLALDAQTGTLLWARHVADPGKGEMFTMPPLIYGDLVFIGPAVGEFGLRGWVGAFRLADGAPAWRFNIVPNDGEPGAETWAHDTTVKLGGGALWTPVSLDPDRGLLYVAAANPAPDLAAAARGGANLYTNSVIALRLQTGALAWYDQIVPHDDHDWDINHAGPLYRASIDGKMHDLIATAGKDGMLRVLDRDTRKMIFAASLTTQSNVASPVTTQGVDVCPGVLGGVQWNGPAYVPEAGVLVTPAVDWCSRYTLDQHVDFVPGQYYLGGSAAMKPDAAGWLTAVNAATGAVTWRMHSPRPMVAAVTSTASGLIFAGALTGELLALDAASGAVLYRHAVGGPLGAGVITYQVAGRQYVAVGSGTPSAFWADPKGPAGGATVTVFAVPDR